MAMISVNNEYKSAGKLAECSKWKSASLIKKKIKKIKVPTAVAQVNVYRD